MKPGDKVRLTNSVVRTMSLSEKRELSGELTVVASQGGMILATKDGKKNSAGVQYSERHFK